MAYRLNIKCVIDGEVKYFDADVANPWKEQLTSKTTDQPMVDGSTITDHMFNEPMTVPFSGTFGLVGDKRSEYSGAQSRLASIQKTFERIKSEGIQCSLVAIDTESQDSNRFLIRDHMVITSINWTPGVNTLDFDFTFKQIMMANVEAIDAEVEDNNDLPDLTDAAVGDFTDSFVDSSVVIQTVIQVLADNRLISNEFITHWSAWVQTQLQNTNLRNFGTEFVYYLRKIGTYLGYYMVAGVGIGAIVAVGVLGGAAAVAAIPGVGWAAAAILVAVGIFGIIHAAKEKERAEATYASEFLYDANNEDRNKQEYERFTTYLVDIMKQLDEFDNQAEVYTISNNTPQDATIIIDNNYYIFCFRKDNTTTINNSKINNITLKVQSVSDNFAEIDCGNVTSALTGISDCNSQNALFKTSNSNIYLMSVAQIKYEADTDHKNWVTVEEAQADLSNYILLISHINLTDFSKTLHDAIVSAMKKAKSKR